MAVRFILMMALMIIGSADPIPDPDQDVYIDVKQIVNAQCGGGCCNNDCPCTFNGKPYGIGANIVEGCAKLCCKRDGEWEFKGFIEDCGNCTVGGDPEIYPFDPVNGITHYKTSATGEHMLVQHYHKSMPYFGVKGHFTAVPLPWFNCSCVNSVTYFQGSATDIENLSKITVQCPCSKPGSCVIKSSPASSPSFPGVILHGHTIGDCIGKSIIIVGTEGLTVVVCERTISNPYPWVYIYASPSLMYPLTSDKCLCGLCNTFTGKTVYDYYPLDGSPLPTPWGPFIDSWKCERKFSNFCL